MNLRDALREGTRGAHDALDSRMSALALSRASDLAAFLAVSAAGFGGIGNAGPADGALAEMRRAIALDLAALGAPVPAPEPSGAADPLAGAYVVLGSRLGAGALARRWPGAPERRYLGLPGRGTDWRALCDELRAMSGTDARAASVIDAARAHFAAFSRAADRHMAGGAHRDEAHDRVA